MKASMSPLVAKKFWIQDALFNTLALLQLIAYLLTSASFPARIDCQLRTLPYES
jgi:GGDEF domain-containing protein